MVFEQKGISEVFSSHPLILQARKTMHFLKPISPLRCSQSPSHSIYQVLDSQKPELSILTSFSIKIMMLKYELKLWFLSLRDFLQSLKHTLPSGHSNISLLQKVHLHTYGKIVCFILNFPGEFKSNYLRWSRAFILKFPTNLMIDQQFVKYNKIQVIDKLNF